MQINVLASLANVLGKPMTPRTTGVGSPVTLVHPPATLVHPPAFLLHPTTKLVGPQA